MILNTSQGDHVLLRVIGFCEFLGIVMMVKRLKQEESLHHSMNLLKIFVKTGASWSAQTLRQKREMQYGSALS